MLNFILSVMLMAMVLIRPFICSLSSPGEDVIYSLTLILICLAWIIGNRKKLALLQHPVFLRILLFFILIVISALASKAPFHSLTQAYKYICAFLVFTVVFVLSEAERKKLLGISIIGLGSVSVAAILWVFQGAVLFKAFLYQNNIYYDFANELLSRGRAFIPFILPSILGGYLIIILPIAIGWFIKYYRNIDTPLFKRPVTNSLLLMPVLLAFFTLLLTKSLGAFLSLLFATLIFRLLQRQKTQKHLQFIVSLCIVMIGFIIIVRIPNVGYWRNPVFSLAQRQHYWSETIQVIKAHPLIGVGLGNLPFVGSKFSHNSYLELWAETGIFGILSFGAIIGCCFKQCLQRGIFYGPILSGLFIGVVAFLLHNMVDFTFFVPEVSLFFWINFSLLCALTATIKTSQEI